MLKHLMIFSMFIFNLTTTAHSELVEKYKQKSSKINNSSQNPRIKEQEELLTTNEFAILQNNQDKKLIFINKELSSSLQEVKKYLSANVQQAFVYNLLDNNIRLIPQNILKLELEAILIEILTHENASNIMQQSFAYLSDYYESAIQESNAMAKDCCIILDAFSCVKISI